MGTNNLQLIRKRAKLTQGAIADRMGVSVPQVSRWETGHDNIPSGRLPDLADAYSTTIGDIFGSAHEYQRAGPRLFVKGRVAAGQWVDSWNIHEDDWEIYTGRADEKAPPSRRFGVRVIGDSMNLVYPEGTILDCVVYDHEEPIPSGKRVIVVRHRGDGSVEATVKELARDDDGAEWLVPRSSNPSFKAFRGDRPDEPDVSTVEIVAVVVASIRPE